MTYNPVTWIRALLAVRKAASDLKEAKMKSGIQTTEFWLSLVSIVGTAYTALQGFIPPELSIKVIAILVVAYTLVRTLLKAAEIVVKFTKTDKDDKIVAGAEQVMDKIETTFGTPKQA
jgi:hypothetical protein